MGVTRIRLGISFAVLGLFSCSHAPQQEPKISITQKAKSSILQGQRLHKLIIHELSIIPNKKNGEIDRYLSHLAERIFSLDEESRFWPPQVYLINSKDGKNVSFVLPGGYVYLAKDDLKQIQSDSELAAFIAFYTILERIRTQDAQNVETIVNSNSLNSVEAVGKTIDLIYRLGFDTRGLHVYFGRIKKDIKKYNFDLITVKKIEDEIRKQYALKTPVLRPIVRTDAFLKIEKDLKKL